MTCYVCGHGPPRIRGRFRMEVGHLDAVKLNPLQLPSTDRARPMHGSNAPCPTCLGRTGRPRCCNQEMGTKTMDEVHKPRSRW